MCEVGELAHQFVHHFGLRKGDRVAICMRNFPEYMVRVRSRPVQ